MTVSTAIATGLLLTLAIPALEGQEATRTVIVVDALPAVAVAPDSAVVLQLGDTFRFRARVTSSGGAVSDAAVVWRSSDSSVLTIDELTGLARSHAPGTARVWAEVSFDQRAGARADSVERVAAPEPRPSADDFVTYGSAEVESILGPQLVIGSLANPWQWFDINALEKGLEHGKAFPPEFDLTAGTDAILNQQYYDLGLVLYNLYHRSGDERYLTLARKVTDAWYPLLVYSAKRGWGTSPRNASMGGMMLRALDGRPDLWPFITSWTRAMFQMWLGARVEYPELYFGVRDGGYMLLYAAWLAQVHPDEAARAEFRDKAVAAARGYYVRLQGDDGGWYWKDDGSASHPGGVWEQPFMIGLLLEALVEVHQMTGDDDVARSIVKSVDHLWSSYRLDDIVPESAGGGVAWRSVPYFIFADGSSSGEEHLAGATATREGWDTNTIREGRQRNSLVVHAFGYAYYLTGDSTYRRRGDEIFAATYGNDRGPAADRFRGLADFRAKEYNQAYRSAGRYLAWRARGTSTPR